ncbi:DnaJ-like subfamily B member 13 [Spatholobus suberectus]|nr:DnaJ-like subfamily B member 13 [Spatholobus suberectus]
MGDHPRSQHLFKIPKTKSLKDVGKVYKSLVSKRHQDKKNPEEPITPSRFELNENKRVDEDIWSPKFLSRAASRRSKTPTPRSRPMSRHGSRRCTTPTSLSRSSSSRRSAAEIAASSLKRIMSRRFPSASLSRNLSRLDISEPELSNPAASPTKDAGIKSPRGTEHIPAVSLSSNLSRRSTTPIIFSQTTARRKPPEVERNLHCTLENLCFGCIKKIKVTRDVIKHPGVIIQEEEVLKIEVKPGWRKGTKITFEGVGDEKPGYLPADIVFLIDEKKHPFFRRDGIDLEICVEIPLVDALTGCSISIPLLGGENMSLSFENIVIYPGYEKVIKGQGMPNPKNNGIRGDLHVKFLIDFPTELTEEQRKEAVNILQDCC